MKIKVIGGSGFIGTRLVSLLNEIHGKENVVILDIAKSETFPLQHQFADVTDIDSLRGVLENQDIVINLAAEHKDNVKPVSKYDVVNVHGAENICTVADEKNIKKIIFTSTVAVYGFSQNELDETANINFFNDYGRTKWEAEKVYNSWVDSNRKEKSMIIVRPTVVFGEGNRGNVYNLFSQISSGKFVMIGNGKNRKSMAYVGNLVAYINELLVSDIIGLFLSNYVDKPDFSMNELVGIVKNELGNSKTTLYIPYSIGRLIGFGFDLLSNVFGKETTISSIRIKKFCSNTIYSSKEMPNDYTAPTSLIEAVKRTIRYEFGGNKC